MNTTVHQALQHLDATTTIDERMDLFATNPHRPESLDPKQLTTILNYLYWFGYISYQVMKHVSIADIVEATHKFQKWFGVGSEKGKLGPKTRWALNYPRCGHPDIPDVESPDKRQFVRLAKAPKWNKECLRYYVRSYVSSKDITHSAQEAIIAQAWKQWTDIIPLTIERSRTAKGADLILDTGRGKADDFDGPGGTLAWAYMPEGDDKQLLMRFDLDETWLHNPKDNGIAMLNVACHEFGHMLGLDHSRKSQSLMAPWYNESVGCPQAVDDISRVCKLYGHRKEAFDIGSTVLPNEVRLNYGGQHVTYVRK